MATVALVPHRFRHEALELAERTIDWLEDRRHEARVPEGAAATTKLGLHACNAGALTDGLDLAVSLGGDGTMLHTVDLLAGSGVPVMGVNVGHLGYLTEVEPAALPEALERFLSGDYKVEDRMSLEVEVLRTGEAEVCVCLNEAVLEKTESGHTIRIAADINGRHFITYTADGLIVSTPTGSTAYNLSARGPILSPAQRAIVVTPVSPHGLFDRSLVLGATEAVRLEVLDGRPAALVLDGRDHGALAPGDTVSCRAGVHDARFVTFGERDFHQILRTKFDLGR